MKKCWAQYAAVCFLLAGSSTAVADDDTCDGSSGWSMFNFDARGSRYNRCESVLGKSNVAGLHIQWTFSTSGAVNATPVVADGVVYAGDSDGKVYALTTSGSLLWQTQVSGPVSATATVAGTMLVLGDQSGNLYGLRRDNGQIAWSFRPDSHPLAAIWGAGVKIGPNVAIGVASNEEFAAANPSYPCCSTRGSLLLLDPRTGHVIWQTYTVTDAQRASGASGASIWSTPSYDAASKLIYATTGNNFSDPMTVTSDALMAFDAQTGAIRWTNQRTPDDTWNYRYTYTPGHVDADFGDSPQVYLLPGGRKVVGAGQKSGFYHVVDAATGALINQIQVEPGGTLGGLFSDTAVAEGTVYANGLNWPGFASNPADAVGGDLIAIAGDGSHELWRFPTPGSPDAGAVAVANGVVYFISSFSGVLYALDSSTGAPLAGVPLGPIPGTSSFDGPSVVNGQVFAGKGLNFGGNSFPGAIIALGL